MTNDIDAGKARSAHVASPGSERCGAKTRAGTPCKSKAIYDNGRCKLHGGMSTGPSTPEGRDRIRKGQKRRREREAGQIDHVKQRPEITPHGVLAQSALCQAPYGGEQKPALESAPTVREMIAKKMAELRAQRSQG